jgi:transposase
MTANYLPYEPQQMLLLPEAIQDWLPEGHLAHFISDTVDMLDLDALHARYDKDGPRNQPFHPSMMVKVLVYGYATGVFSSRKIARKLHEDVAFRVLAAGNFPAHRTIRDFRAFHLKELSELFVQVVRLAREMGLVKLGTIAVDGTKLKANASRHKAMSYSHMLEAQAELKAQIEALLKRAQQADEAEKNEPELDVPAQIARREARLAAISEARQRLEQRQRDADLERGRDPDEPPRGGRYKREFGVPEDKAQDNFTDPDSRIMKRAGGGFDASYNAQTAVDDEAHIIVAAELTNNASDAGELPTMLPSRRWPIPAIRPRRCSRPWPAAAAIWWWHSGARASRPCASIPSAHPIPQRWRPSCRPIKARRRTGDASGSPSRPTAGSRTCSGSVSSACGGYIACAPSGSSCAWR